MIATVFEFFADSLTSRGVMSKLCPRNMESDLRSAPRALILQMLSIKVSFSENNSGIGSLSHAVTA